MRKGPALSRRPFRFMKRLCSPMDGGRKPWLQLPDVRRLVALGSLDDVELDTVTLGQAAESLGLNRREMNEHVLAVLLRDEAKALGVVEPLHGTLAHLRCFLSGSIWLCRCAPVWTAYTNSREVSAAAANVWTSHRNDKNHL